MSGFPSTIPHSRNPPSDETGIRIGFPASLSSIVSLPANAASFCRRHSHRRKGSSATLTRLGALGSLSRTLRDRVDPAPSRSLPRVQGRVRVQHVLEPELRTNDGAGNFAFSLYGIQSRPSQKALRAVQALRRSGDSRSSERVSALSECPGTPRGRDGCGAMP
jgi:hypothetical protein